MYENRTLVRGDNLEEMRRFPDDCIDLIATDPPFNSKRNYFVPYRDQHGQEPDTLIRAFTDTWTWGEAAEDAYQQLLVEEGGQIGNTIQGLRQFLNETPMMAYLVMMAVRIVEMHRILKPLGVYTSTATLPPVTISKSFWMQSLVRVISEMRLCGNAPPRIMTAIASAEFTT